MSNLEPLNDPVSDVPVASLDSIADWANLFIKLRKKQREIKEQLDEAREIIAQHIEEQDGEFGSVAGRTVIRWRTMETNRFNVSRFRKAYPELAAEFTDTRNEQRMEIVDDDDD